jgi:hypothetical protein
MNVSDSLNLPAVPSAVVSWLETETSTCMEGIILVSKVVNTNGLQ